MNCQPSAPKLAPAKPPGPSAPTTPVLTRLAEEYKISDSPGLTPSSSTKGCVELECDHLDDQDEFMSSVDESDFGDGLEDVLELNSTELCPVVSEGGLCEIMLDSGAGASVINPDDLPGVPVKPSEGSKRGQRYVGPGGEKIANEGELQVDLETEGSGNASRIVFQAARVRKPLLAVSGVVGKGNIVVFSAEGSFILPGNRNTRAKIQAAIDCTNGKIPLHQKNGVFVMRCKRKGAGGPEPVFSRPGSK